MSNKKLKDMKYSELIEKLEKEAELAEAKRKVKELTGFDAGKEEARRARTEWEHELQVRCVHWFKQNNKELESLLFAIPNGGYRSKKTAVMMRCEGVTAGVADLMLAVPSGSWHGLFIEMKVERSGSKQSDHQKAWQVKVESQGYRYEVVKSFSAFKTLIGEYLNPVYEDMRDGKEGS